MKPTAPVLFYPVKPLQINQQFGANPTYYEATFGQKGHPGIDFEASHGQPVYAAHDGEAIYIKDSHGGEGIWLYAPGFITIYWHLIGDTDPKYPPTVPFSADGGTRTPVKRGDIIGYADNTGAPYESSGDHLHFGLMLTDANGVILNQENGTQGCVDPQPYFNGELAHPLDEAASETEAVATDISKIAPTAPTAPQQENLIEEAIEVISEELKDIL